MFLFVCLVVVFCFLKDCFGFVVCLFWVCCCFCLCVVCCVVCCCLLFIIDHYLSCQMFRANVFVNDLI